MPPETSRLRGTAPSAQALLPTDSAEEPTLKNVPPRGTARPGGDSARAVHHLARSAGRRPGKPEVDRAQKRVQTGVLDRQNVGREA